MGLKVIGIGDNVVDKYLHSGIMYPGGNALNFAVYAKRLGADSSYMGVFGMDTPGEHVRNTLNQLGVKTERCRIVQGENGYACINLVNGDRIFIRSNKGGVLREHNLILDEDDLAYLKKFDLIHSSLNSYLEPELKKIKSLGVTLSFDFSVRGTDEYFQQVCPYVDYGFVSCGELSLAETEGKIVKLFHCGCKAVIATRGPEGAIYYDGGEKIIHRPQYVQPVDSLGAGDSFLTGFLLYIEAWKKNRQSKEASAEDQKLSILAAMQQGSRLAAETLQTCGAFGYGMPFDKL